MSGLSVSGDFSAGSSDEYLPPKNKKKIDVSTSSQYESSEDEEFPSKNVGKKKVKRPECWKRNVRKNKRDSGKDYESVRGKKVQGKVFRCLTTCCSKKCAGKINKKEKYKLFSEFWDIGDKVKQDLFLLTCLEKVEKKRESVGPNKLKRDNQWKYYMTVQSVKIPVCRKLLLSILQISEKRLRTVQKFKQTGQLFLFDFSKVV